MAAEEMGQTDLVTNDSMTGSYPYAIGSQNLPKAHQSGVQRLGGNKGRLPFLPESGVEAADIIETHRRRRRNGQSRTDHPRHSGHELLHLYQPTKTKGLGAMSLKKGNMLKAYLQWLSCMRAGRDHGGRAVGILDQNIFVRKLRSAERRRLRMSLPLKRRKVPLA